jgi:hypothetical protein
MHMYLAAEAGGMQGAQTIRFGRALRSGRGQRLALIANRIVDRGREFVSGSNGVAAWTS